MNNFGDGLISVWDICLPFGKKESMPAIIHVIITCYYCFYLKVRHRLDYRCWLDKVVDYTQSSVFERALLLSLLGAPLQCGDDTSQHSLPMRNTSLRSRKWGRRTCLYSLLAVVVGCVDKCTIHTGFPGLPWATASESHGELLRDSFRPPEHLPSFSWGLHSLLLQAEILKNVPQVLR